MCLSIIVAVARNRAIGKDNALPWHLPADLQYFKKMTLGKPIIMGRKTYESIGRPLPGRLNIVVTRQSGWTAEGVEVVNSLEAALVKGEESGASEVMLIGGAELYAAGLDLADKLYVTEVDVDVDGDAFFPPIASDIWVETGREEHGADAKNGYDYAFTNYLRRNDRYSR